MVTDTRTEQADLDFVSRYEPGSREFMTDTAGFVVEFGLTGFQLIDPSGPAGGNPIVRFYGSPEKIQELRQAWEV